MSYKMKIYIVIFVIGSSAVTICNGLTMAQLKKTGNMMKTSCMPKNNVTNDQVKNINKGEFPEDRNVKCYIACILQMAQMMKNGKLNYDAAVKQINLLFPDDLKAPNIQSLDKCRKIPDKHKDVCDASFHTAKCMYDYDSEHFVFP